MTPAQYNAAKLRLTEADRANGHVGLGAGSLFDPVTGCYCAIGALLNGPDGFDTPTLKAWDRTVTERMSVNAMEPQCFSAALPDRAAARLLDVYGLDLDQIELIVLRNDGTDSEERLAEVLDQLHLIYMAHPLLPS